MSNLFTSAQTRDFYVYVDPKDRLIQHQVGLMGAFTSVQNDPSVPTQMFLPNQEFQGFVSPFQSNLLRSYIAEYNLELSRQRRFTGHPCRLEAIFLLDSAEEAEKYAATNPDHVDNRVLKRCVAVGPYRYSVHDSAWVNFLRLGGSKDEQTLDSVGNAYWSGARVIDHELMSMGRTWSEEPILEVLFLGRIDFPDKTLEPTLEELDRRLTRAAKSLDEAASQIRDLKLDPERNVRKIGECLANIFDIREDICKLRPDLMPDFLKK